MIYVLLGRMYTRAETCFTHMSAASINLCITIVELINKNELINDLHY